MARRRPRADVPITAGDASTDSRNVRRFPLGGIHPPQTAIVSRRRPHREIARAPTEPSRGLTRGRLARRNLSRRADRRTRAFLPRQNRRSLVPQLDRFGDVAATPTDSDFPLCSKSFNLSSCGWQCRPADDRRYDEALEANHSLALCCLAGAIRRSSEHGDGPSRKKAPMPGEMFRVEGQTAQVCLRYIARRLISSGRR
jgi:hypothetical protein